MQKGCASEMLQLLTNHIFATVVKLLVGLLVIYRGNTSTCSDKVLAH
jgi:hypothetical protein